MVTLADKGGRRVWEMLTLFDKGGDGLDPPFFANYNLLTAHNILIIN